jgi:methylated-DNA-[protein]-cysteine S-methyltransferase
VKAGGFLFARAWFARVHSSSVKRRVILQRVMPETLLSLHTPSPVGPLFLVTSAKGLVRLEFKARMQKLPESIRLQESEAALAPEFAPYIRELNQYFAGERREFSFPLDLRGTDFQLACWNALLQIPYGATCSYRDIAVAIGHPHAFRAVGMSNNRNPIAIVVPCHRVIASDGSLCGYGGGLDLKCKLLDLEQRNLRPGERLSRGSAFKKSTLDHDRPDDDRPCLPFPIGA